MSRTIDEKIVSMQFDNKQFESNVKTSLSTLDKLKQSLKLDGASKGLENVSSAAKSFDMSPMGNGIEMVQAKFSALEVMAVTALANITNSVVNVGKKLVSAITIEPIKSGFQEYETQMNAVQTILANTQKEGTNVKIVNAALDDLNHYADKTIYNFTEMTRNIGTFTAAGVKLDTSVSAIKGIANLAAVSGSSSQQASTAMYQLSQAIASGTVKLMDWNSVVNAGMGGQVFQDALIRTSEHLKTGANAAIKAKGSFRESLQEGWLTTEVLTQTLDQFATAADTQEEYEAAVKKFVDQGYTQEEAKQMADMARTAGDAATKVKTFSQLIDTLKEALGSGWTESWRLIIGDFEEAKELWTQASDYFSEAINKSSDARNELIKAWADGGGREMGIEAIKNAFDALLRIVKPIKEALSEVFPRVTSDQLLKITKSIKDFTEKLKISDETADKLKRTFKGVEAIKNAFDALLRIVKPIKEALSEVFPRVTSDQLLKITKSIKDFTEKLKISDETADKLKRTFKGVFSVFDIFKKVLGTVGKAIVSLLGSDGVSSLGSFLLDITASIGDFLTSLNEGFSTDGISGIISKAVSGISNALKGAVSGLGSFGDMLSSVGSTITTVVGKIWEALKGFFGWLTENMSFKGILSAIAGIFGVLTGKKLYNAASGVQEFIQKIFDKSGFKQMGIKEKISDLLNSVHDSLQSFTSGIKVSSLLAIAAAIGILAASMNTIAKLKFPDVLKSLTAIGVMFKMLSVTLDSVTKSLSKNGSKGLIKAGVSLLLIAEAINILAKAMTKMAGLSLKEIGKGLIGIGGGLAELCAGLKVLDGTKVSLRTSVAMLALAESCKILADALEKFGKMKWDEIKHGLVGMGGALAELVISLGVLNKFGGGGSLLGSVSILIVVQSLKKMADGLKSFGDMKWDEIKRGLAGMGGALAELSVAVGALGKFSGFSGVLGSVSILLVVQSLQKMADAFKDFGSMSWDEIKHGLVGMGGALAEVGGMSGALGKIAGFSGLLGAGAILMTVQGLGDLADAFKDFGSMSWDEIKRGLVGMGGALTEVGVISGALGYLTNFAGLLGSGSLLLAIQGLGDLADAFKKFGEMSWDEIKQGLAGMAGALGETALGGLLNTFSGFGAAVIGEMAQPLGDLADAVKKWSGVTVPEGLSLQLGSLASGVNTFMFSGTGADAIATAAPGVGAMADAVKKWSGVTIPEGIGSSLGSLANGVNTFTFSGLGASAIATVAPGIGTLADSVKKWSGVTVPEGIGTKLMALANGINSFTFSGMGAGAIATAAPAIGTMADSIKKWSNVTIPENIGTQLSDLANGVKAFSFAFMGGLSIATLVEPLGNLAGSVKKWNGVKIPDTLGDQLDKLASGVKAFTFAFIGAWTIDTLVEPLGNLAGAVKKWNGVSIPEGLGDQLSTLATGVKSFANVGDISGATSGMKTIASSVNTLSSINFGTISDGFTSLITSITNLSAAGPIISSAAQQISSSISSLMTGLVVSIASSGPMISMAFSSVITNALNSVVSNQQSFYFAGTNAIQSFASGITAGGGSVMVSVSAFVSMIATSISGCQGLFQNAGIMLMTQFYAGINIGMNNVRVTVSSAITRIVSYLNNNQGRFQASGMILMTQFNSAILSGSSMVISTMNVFITRLLTMITNRAALFSNAGRMLMERMKQGIMIGGAGFSAAIASIIVSAVSTINSCYQSFYSAGAYLGDGLIDGIESKETEAYDAGYALGQAAVQGEKDGQQSNSPSKLTIKAGKWIGEGLVIGMNQMSKSVYKAGENMGGSAVDSISGALARVSNSTKYAMDVQPTIRPVVDLSNVNAMNFDLGSTVKFSMAKPINSLSQIVTDAQSSIDASNREVVSAIDGLRKDLSELYSSDGQEVALYVDSKKLASSIAKPMNRQLNILSKRGDY
jgi:tape measure domain-containing protein